MKHSLYVIIALQSLLIAYLWYSENTIQLVEIESKWCFYAEYDSYDKFNAVQRPEMSFIGINGTRYQVFAPCEHDLWHENGSTR